MFCGFLIVARRETQSWSTKTSLDVNARHADQKYQGIFFLRTLMRNRQRRILSEYSKFFSDVYTLIIRGLQSICNSYVPNHPLSCTHLTLLADNPVNHFPTYEPSAERVEEIRAQYAEENNPLNVHYDASHEVRAKGAGFYQFSGDEETRRKQMEELKKAREETEQTRAEFGAVDLAPGEGEGAEAGGESVVMKKSKAMEKRKRELEERRKMLDAKRRKKDPRPEEKQSDLVEVLSPPDPPPPPRSPPPSSLKAPADDPFAILETQFSTTGSKAKASLATGTAAADDFLAALERDMLKGAR